MGINYAKQSGVSNKQTSQQDFIPGRESEQAKNNAGGVSFVIDRLSRLRRFLILGSEGGTYYVGERKLTKENATNAISTIKSDGMAVLNMLVEISDQALAKSNDPAIFVLALCFAHGSPEVKAAAEKSLPMVCRIGTHLFHFVGYAKDLIGWNRRLARAVSNWYTQRSDEKLEMQMVKYQSRDGWSHHDVLHLCHAKPLTPVQDNLFYWAKKGVSKNVELEGKFLAGYREAHADKENIPKIVKLIKENGLSREMLPTECLGDKRIWEAMLPHMGYEAMLRNLGKMSSIGLVERFGDNRNLIVEKILNTEQIAKSRIHPFAILLAMRVYGQGHGVKGQLSWMADQKIVAALDDAFYASFKNVQPSGGRVLLGLDVSGSMGSPMMGSPITCREASAAMALVTAKVEKDYEVMGFSTGFIDLKINEKDTLASATKKVSGLPFQGTDCSLPMVWASKHGIKNIHGFVIYTDNETWAGDIHPSQALRSYRNSYGPQAKLAVVAMSGTQFSIADPQDSGQLDFVGFDASAPSLLSEFIAGKL